jgi:steroid 5-alpha reductase family enzyme
MLQIALVLLAALAGLTLAMLAGWRLQRSLDQPAWSDAVWTFAVGCAGVFAALIPLEILPAPLARRALYAALCGAWSLRLGLHIVRRTARGGRDARYEAMRAQFGERFQREMLGFMLIQAPVGAVLALSVLIAAHAPGALGAADIAAVVVMALAVLGEGVADAQLARFKADPANRGGVCDRGLWARSRHPNYVCEWLVWMAYPTAALGFGLLRPWVWISLASPLLMYVLLRRVSGVPPLEAAMLQSRGELFRAYQARTPVFFPFLKSGA